MEQESRPMPNPQMIGGMPSEASSPAVEEIAAPKPKRRRLSAIAFRVALSLFVLGCGAVAAAAYFLIVPRDRSATPREFTIEPGERLPAIVAALEREGFVHDGFSLALLLRIQGKEGEVKAGTFTLSPAMAPRRIAEILTAAAPPERDVAVAVPEGFTIWETAARLSAEGVVSDAGALLAALVHVPPYAFLPACNVPAGAVSCTKAFAELEGFLFPDTYRFRKASSPDDIAEKFLENFDRKLSADLRRDAEAAGRSLEAILAVASLVEEEAKFDADRARVAGIIWKRFDISMALQIDATVLYAKAKRAGGALDDRVLTAEDLTIDSLYNTYKYPGLPPGPIASPGIKSIIAAVRPEQSPYLFYLNAPDGTTIFSRTLEEHNRAKAQYLR